ncbi:Protein Phosphatase Slingshot-like 2 [Manis pentadactyla]|nr:Protein Phosphatase Slingshot-like 2 [Manis pentadactyla]
MALVTVQRSPTPSTTSSPCASEADSGEEECRSQPRRELQESVEATTTTIISSALCGAVPPWHPHNNPDKLLHPCVLQLTVSVSAHPIKVQKIQAKGHNPGLRDFEVHIIRLLDKIMIG